MHPPNQGGISGSHALTSDYSSKSSIWPAVQWKPQRRHPTSFHLPRYVDDPNEHVFPRGMV